MTSRVNRIHILGKLRSRDGLHRRACVVELEMRVDEASGEEMTYSFASIVDSDDWQDGEYEVEFEKQTERLWKKDGRYSDVRR